MITIKINRSGQKPLIAHVQNEKNCKMWLKLFSGDFDTVEIKHAKSKEIIVLQSKLGLARWLEQ